MVRSTCHTGPMTLLSTSPAVAVQHKETARIRLRGLIAIAAIAPLTLMGCTQDEETAPATPQNPQSGQPSAETEEPQQTPAPESNAQGESSPEDGNSGEVPPGEGPGGELPDPDDMNIERTVELGAYFSEDEACMSVGSMMDGLQTDMNAGVEEQDVLDEIYSAVEQNYILVPIELREPLENILTLLDTEADTLDEEAVLVAAEPVAGWLTVGFCEGEYHNQMSPGDA